MAVRKRDCFRGQREDLEQEAVHGVNRHGGAGVSQTLSFPVQQISQPVLVLRGDGENTNRVGGVPILKDKSKGFSHQQGGFAASGRTLNFQNRFGHVVEKPGFVMDEANET